MRMLRENLALKLLSVAVAVLLWLATVGDPQATTALAVPVQYRNTPADLEISSQLVDSAYIEARGAGGRLSGANLANAVVVVDLAGERRPGERTISIVPANVKLPVGVKFIRAVPSQIRLRLEPRAARDAVVMVRYAAPAPGGHRIALQEVVPPQVRIVGPESRVNAIDRVQTDPIELSDEMEQVFHVHTYAGDPQVRLERSDLLITVKVKLAPDPSFPANVPGPKAR